MPLTDFPNDGGARPTGYSTVFCGVVYAKIIYLFGYKVGVNSLLISLGHGA